MQAPTIDDVRSAAEVVRHHLPRTLLYNWPLLSARLGFSFHLKHENHQPHGAFKIRGGVNLVSRLSDDERRRGIIGCSTGNHGQSLAFAAKKFDVPCTIVVPQVNNPDKVAAIRSLGAEIIEHGRDFDEAKQHCEQLAVEKNLRYVHSANEPLLIAGVGTMALEIFDVVASPDVLLVPIGLGSGVCGAAIVAASVSPKTRVIGVQSTGASAVAQSWRQGKTIASERIDTFAEGLATRAPAELTLDIMRRLMHDVVLVTDDELREAMRWIIADTHNLPEPAGAASTAAAWKLREPLAGRTVVGVLSGGNCDTRLLRELFA
ncbi:MAG: threonine dehydratase [Pirellulaceae bacterium]